MTIDVSDVRSNPNDQIVHAAEVIGNSKKRREVFKAVYLGKKRIKKVSEIMEITKMDRVKVLQAGNELASNKIINQIRKDKQVAYEQVSFFQSKKKKILSLAGNKKKIENVPTKRNSTKITNIVKKIPISKLVRVKQITIEDIDNFSKTKNNKKISSIKPILEKSFKKGMQDVIGEPGVFKDWGGEKNDLFSSRVRIKGKRLTAAFAFKGRSKKGKLVPGMMGKNGDQIQRLFDSPAQLFIVQYWDIIDQSIIELMYRLAVSKSVTDNKEIFFGIIDGKDTQKIIESYSNFFEGVV